VENSNKIHHGSFLNNTLPDKSQHLIIGDPPYYKVKGEFDFIWKTFDDHLKDVELWAKECKRLLADNGSLLWYGSAKKIAYTQIILDKYFNLVNNAVWNKGSFMGLEESKGLRSLAPCTERILFYENGDKTGTQEIYDNPDCFRSIKKYMRNERDKLMVSKGFKTIAAFNQFINELTETSNVVSRHYFADSQYSFPTPEIYKKMQSCGFWQREYEELRREYEELRREYEELRRPYNNEFKLQEVLNFSNEAGKYKGFDHDTPKPEKLTETLILTTSRKGNNIFIPFAGSGTECSMSAKTGRNFEGWDIEKKYVDMSNERVAQYLMQLTLF